MLAEAAAAAFDSEPCSINVGSEFDFSSSLVDIFTGSAVAALLSRRTKHYEDLDLDRYMSGWGK